jgi:hypothetical protein
LGKVRARSLVGQDVALTRRRSPVQVRPGPPKGFAEVETVFQICLYTAENAVKTQQFLEFDVMFFC